MWLLANDGEALGGKRIWLKPGHRYLFGRTVAEPGQFAIQGPKASTVSRKHFLIHVDAVPHGDGKNPASRAQVTVEDLGSKIGTTVNDQKVKGEKYVIKQDENVLKMGSFPSKFTITWFPVVLSYSFTSRERQGDPLASIQQSLEQLDIKFLAEYNADATTHVISKKRNTSKGLQALINGRYIVTSLFVDKIVAASTPEQIEDGVQRSRLEANFDKNWPDALKCLPPAGVEPAPRPVAAFAPDPARKELFDGYTFIFYDRTQYDCLYGPINNGKGKAVFSVVTPFQTATDEFVRYVKEMAGEKGLGEFEDGSQGKGVVVVRYLPQNPPDIEAWYSQFHTNVALRLDHRLIDQKDFLDAVLACDASLLRRPLEEESRPATQEEPQDPPPPQGQQSTQQSTDTETAASAASPDPTVLRRPVRGPARSRFRGFVKDDSDDDMQDTMTDLPPPPAYAPVAPAPPEPPQEEGLFVSQEAEAEEPAEATHGAVPSHRKRLAPVPQYEAEDVLDEYAPNAARIKRRRIEARGDTNARQAPEPETSTAPIKSKKEKEIDYQEIAARNRAEAETRAAEERAALNAIPEDFDPADIRRLRIEEPMEVRQTAPLVRSRDDDVANGRWDPAWNGRKNFKKFQQRGAVNPARPPQRIILGLEEAKKKPNGLGDEYWLEEDSNKQWRQDRLRKIMRDRELRGAPTHRRLIDRLDRLDRRELRNSLLTTSTEIREMRTASLNTSRGSREPRNASLNTSRDSQGSRRTVAVPSPSPAVPTSESSKDAYGLDDDDDDDDEDAGVDSSVRSRSTRAAAAAADSAEASQATIASRISRDSWTAAKRPAAAPPPQEQPAKRPKIIEVEESEEEESDGELRFRFRRR